MHSPPLTIAASEKMIKNIVKVAKHPGLELGHDVREVKSLLEPFCSSGSSGKGGAAELVILLSFFIIAQHRNCFIYLFKFLFIFLFFIIWSAIGMILHRQLLKGFFYFFLGSALVHTQNLIIIFICHFIFVIFYYLGYIFILFLLPGHHGRFYFSDL